MKNNKKSKINACITREVWIQRFRDLRWNALFVILLIAALVIYTADAREAGPNVRGNVISLHSGSSEKPKPSRLVVRLDSGHEVLVSGSSNIPVYIGKRVLLSQTVTKLFGVHRYYFVRYIPASN
ncbi:hypothetical protein [Kiloniella antarctica]|uniref:Uncharacterized protein n=1 Tax=Kiloniella antarctica TaxID=1550907 RepID=A0ABW5BN26_9PROT